MRILGYGWVPLIGMIALNWYCCKSLEYTLRFGLFGVMVLSSLPIQGTADGVEYSWTMKVVWIGVRKY